MFPIHSKDAEYFGIAQQKWMCSLWTEMSAVNIFPLSKFQITFFCPTSHCEQIILQQLNFMINNVKIILFKHSGSPLKLKTDLDIMNSISLFHNFVILVCNMFVCVCVCMCVYSSADSAAEGMLSIHTDFCPGLSQLDLHLYSVYIQLPDQLWLCAGNRIISIHWPSIICLPSAAVWTIWPDDCRGWDSTLVLITFP